MQFSPGLNVIIGDSDHGKSAILRSLFFLFSNLIGGDKLVRYDADISSVSSEIDDKTVTRSKKPSNKYTIGKKAYGSFGVSLPYDIEQTLNFSPLNFHTQFDRAFMVFETPGERGRILNRVVNLTEIDRSIKKAKYVDRDEKRRIFEAEEKLTELKSEKEELDWILDAERDLNVIEGLAENQRVINSQIEWLSDKLSEIKTLLRDKKKADLILQAKEQIKEIEQLSDRLKAKQDEIDNGQQLLNELEVTERKLSEVEQKVKKMKTKFRQMFPDICPLCGR
jgi:exonuclease SbcC